jgi:hypothetical protein
VKTLNQLFGLRRDWRTLSRSRRFRLKLRFWSILLGGAGGLTFAVLLQLRLWSWVWIPVLAAGAASFVEFLIADLLTESKFTPTSARRLDLLQQALTDGADKRIEHAIAGCIRRFHGCRTDLVKGTVHLLVSRQLNDESETVETMIQLTEYADAGHAGQRWRDTPTTKGIVGQCFREQQKVFVNFADRDEYELRMVREFGFTRAEMAKHDIDGRSYLAFPLQRKVEAEERGVPRSEGGGAVHFEGVLYFYSPEPQVFPWAAGDEALNDAAEQVLDQLAAAHVLEV